MSVLLRVAGAGFLMFSLIPVTAADAAPCRNPAGIGTSRTIYYSPRSYGRISPLQGRHLGLRNKELVLTFDDGPHPRNTRKILRILKDNCVRATFFSVGKMARWQPALMRRIARGGHTIATHSWAHPRDLSRLSRQNALFQIEKGISAVRHSLAGRSAHPIPTPYSETAPFFRYPGLHDSRALNLYLKSRAIAPLSIDIDSRDWSYRRSDRLYRHTLRQIIRRGRGIVLMHDIQPVTARMLPRLLASLKQRGYSIVHLSWQRTAPLMAWRPPLRLRASIIEKTDRPLKLARQRNAVKTDAAPL